MPWYFPWSDAIKKRACRYLLQRYLGQFLQEKLSLDQLSVDLYSGKGTISDVYLDVEALNEIGETYNLPIEFVDGYISSISVSIPWSALLSDNSNVEVHGLMMTIQPKQRSVDASIFDSMWGSMTTSMQLAEECLRQETSESEKEAESSQPFEGLELFAQTIETVLCRIKVRFFDTVIRIEHMPKEGKSGVALEMHLKKVDYFDEAGTEVISAEGVKKRNIYEPVAFSVKKFYMEGTSLYTDEFPHTSRTFARSLTASNDSSPPSKSSEAATPGSPEMPPPHSPLCSDSANETQQEPVSDPVLISRLNGQQHIRLKLKQNEAVLGPKVDVEFNFGPIVFFLSPRQVHILLELAKGLAQPDLEDRSNVLNGRGTRSKPMGAADYALVEQELQRQLVQPPVLLPTRSLHQHQGWSSHSLNDSDEEFLPMTTGGATTNNDLTYLTPDMEMSCSSVGSNTTKSSSTSVDVSSPLPQTVVTKKTKVKSRGSVHGLLQDPLTELTQFCARCSSLCIIILHDDVVTCSSMSSISGLSPPSLSTVSVMKLKAEKFFSELSDITMAGYSFRDFEAMRKQLSSICKTNHLRLQAAPLTIEGNEKSSFAQWLLSASLTIASLEVLECLFDRVAGRNDVILPQYTEILSFCSESLKTESLSSWNEPCLRLKCQQIERASQTRSLNQPNNSLELRLGPLYTEIDISIMDRIHALLNPQPLCGVSEKYQDATNNMWNEDDHPATESEKTNIFISSPFVVISVRFPIPDLRPLHDMDRVPWWQQNIQKDSLILELSDASLTTSLNSSESDIICELQCKDGHGLYKNSPSEQPISFLRVSVDSTIDSNTRDDGFDWPRLVIKISPPSPISVLEDETIDREDSIQATSLDTSLYQMDPDIPSLFATRRIVHEADVQCDADGGDKRRHTPSWEAEQVIMPADKYKIFEFIQKTVHNARYCFEFTLPTANLILPNKHFYEVLYNRLTTDLVLWEPAAPRPMRPCDSSALKIPAPALDLASQLTHNKSSGPFSICRSGLQYDSSSDSEENGGVFYSIYDSQKQRRKHQKPQLHNLQTKCAVTVSIARGNITLHTPLRDISGNVLPGQQSELQLHVEDAHFFAASSYRGNPNDSHICLQANRAALYHNGMLPVSLENRQVEIADLIPPPHLYPTIYRTESGILLEQGMTVGLGGDSVDMLSVAININMDEEQFIKTYKVALGIRGATLRHRMSQPPQSWLTQFIDFFDVEDYPVSGYQPPSIVTELHLHLFTCAIDYRPLYLPLRAALTVEHFSISSNISAETTTSVLRVIAEELCLYISSRTDVDAMDLKQCYVCVVDTGLFDFSVRMTDGKDPLHPKFELQASNNIVHIRTCADSFQALQNLLTYFANDGDFYQEPTKNSEVHLLVAEGSSEVPVALSKSQVDQVHDLMAEAMKESVASQNSSGNSPVEQKLSPHFSDSVAIETDIYDQDLADEIDSLSADDEFCILEDDPGIGIAPKGGESQVRLLTTETIRLVENHFAIPSGKTDQLKAPKHFPPAVLRYTLREMSLILHLYGGYDFDCQKSRHEKAMTDKHVRIQDDKKDNFCEINKIQPSAQDQSFTPAVHFHPQGMGVSFSKSNQKSHWTTAPSSLPTFGKGHHTSLMWQVRGGKNRQHDVLMELEMHKVRFQHEIYPDGTEQASRQVLLIHDVEIRDRLASSQINKFLYQYTSEAMPRQSHANMIVIKAVHIRPDPSLPTQECSLRVSIKPLRLNIDQDALLFLHSFFTDAYNISGGKEEVDNNAAPKNIATTVHQSPVMGITSPAPSGLTPTEPNGLLILLQERTEETADLITPVDSWDPVGGNGNSPGSGTSWGNVSSPIFFRSFIFSPDVPIRLDYQGKRVDMDQGVLAGILMGLGQLSCSELRLKRLSYRHGLLGLDKLLSFALNEWLQDIKRNQLPSLLGGVGPMHSFVQLFQGIRDLFWLPIEQYRKDGRIVRGLQRGANSFTTSTAMACLELTNRLVQTIQGAAEFAYDMVSPGPSVKSQTQGQRKWQASVQKRFPADIREGMATAFHVVREGLGDTARTIVRVAAEECEHKGVPGAVGGVLRQIPPSVVKPIILATEATSSVLGGVRNQLVRDAHREAVDKWRAEPSHL